MPTERIGESGPRSYRAIYIAPRGKFVDPRSGVSFEPGDRGPKEIDQELADYIRKGNGAQFEIEEIQATGSPDGGADDAASTADEPDTDSEEGD